RTVARDTVAGPRRQEPLLRFANEWEEQKLAKKKTTTKTVKSAAKSATKTASKPSAPTQAGRTGTKAAAKPAKKPAKKPAMQLNVIKPSVNNLSVRIFARAAKLDVEEKDVYGATRSADFLKRNPAHLTPMLEEKGLPRGALWESCAIMQ